MRILIAGAGIGGLAAALALLRHGFEVSIHEHAQTLSEVGAGLQIGPNGAKVLQALGLTEALAAVAFHPESAEMRVGTSGRVIFSLPLGEPALRRYGAPYYHLHRADLHAVLKQAVEARAPGCIHLGHEVREVRQDAQGVELGFANGTSDRGALLIGADGVHSVVRRELFDIADGEYTGMSA